MSLDTFHHLLEKESGFYFYVRYLYEKVQAKDRVEVEKYLSGFTKIDDNQDSMKIFYKIRKQKYLEALDRRDKANVLAMLDNKLKVFSTLNEEGYKEITQLLTLSNFSLNWLHLFDKNPWAKKNPRLNPDIKTEFTDHICTRPNGPPVAADAKPASSNV
ncbi:hypothetical protein Pint_19718 [Pistacia integerrima]|uniref:Uncharacterized protein n=1 Tax=Pistacia integerrima TaxID=434235 RepID=A0ACC0XC77_9ROSI|nr:hypothetical protein Pint_19718 [Pistacia integerrima]